MRFWVLFIGAVLPSFLQNFVLRDKRMMLLSLRRCASVAVTKPISYSWTDAGATQGLRSTSSRHSAGRALSITPRLHDSRARTAHGKAGSLSGERSSSRDDNLLFAGRGSCTSLPSAAAAEGVATDDRFSNKYPGTS